MSDKASWSLENFSAKCDSSCVVDKQSRHWKCRVETFWNLFLFRFETCVVKKEGPKQRSDPDLVNMSPGQRQ